MRCRKAATTSASTADAAAALGIVDNSAADTSTTSTAPVSEQLQLLDKLQTDSTVKALFLFFLLGLGLAFTPCVFPMYPILTSIIVGQGQQLSGKRAFSLSMAYVQGMAVSYSLLGLLVASFRFAVPDLLSAPYSPGCHQHSICCLSLGYVWRL